MINIVIPMAGLGSRFSKAGYEKNKKCIGCKQNLIVRVSKKVLGNFLLTMELFPPGKGLKAVERRLVNVTD